MTNTTTIKIALGSTAMVRAIHRRRDTELLAALLSGLVDQAVKWWVDHDQPGPAAMADEVLWLIAGGLPTSLVGHEVQP